MLSRVFSGATIGLESVIVEVEVDIPDQGFPGFSIVGLPGKAVKESCERVRSAIKNSGFQFPNKKIIVNLTPADLPKEGTLYDLPIALGILISDSQVKLKEKALVFGELSLEGSLRHTPGALPLALLARNKNIFYVYLPKDNSKEAGMISKINVYPIENLKQLVDFLNDEKHLDPIPLQEIKSNQANSNFGSFDMADIKGQEQAKRVAEIAAAGGHNVFMMGPPGSGKTMLARTLPSILPEMTEEEMLEITKIYSISGKLSADISAITTRPFRSPHHTTSMVGLVGGGAKPAPGEISLAHRGVLFLDEFLEFSRASLESLRQPMEDGIVTVSRAAGTLQFPAKFLLVAAANPCPCGFLGSKIKHCTCLPGNVDRYRQRMSGPIMDRIDLHITVPEVEVEKLSQKFDAEKSESIRKRVNTARDMQTKRFSDYPKLVCNADMNTKQIKKICKIDETCQKLLNQAVSKMGLSARAYFRSIKVARTIADLEEAKEIKASHIAEALQYRGKDEKN